MQVSVIIPVYNAGKYVRQAVESALIQPQTAEVVLVEDGSPDDSLEVCQQLAIEYDKVKLYQHPNGENRGAGATRNLAIEKCQHDYIAFLDADDFFLESHLTKSQEVFEADPTIEGTYSIAGWHFEDNQLKERLKLAKINYSKPIGITTYVKPEDVFQSILHGRNGYFSIITIVVKHSVISKVGLFDVHLRTGQDTAWRWKLAAVCRLKSAELKEPTVIIRVHEENRWSRPRPAQEKYKQQKAVIDTLVEWGQTHLTARQKNVAYDHYYRRIMRLPRADIVFPIWMNPLLARIWLLQYLIENPQAITNQYYWKNFFNFMREWYRVFRTHFKNTQ